MRNKIEIIKSGKGRNFYFIIKSFIKFLDAIVPLITLGYYWTNIEYQFTKYWTFKGQ